MCRVNSFYFCCIVFCASAAYAGEPASAPKFLPIDASRHAAGKFIPLPTQAHFLPLRARGAGKTADRTLQPPPAKNSGASSKTALTTEQAQQLLSIFPASR